MLKHFLEKKLIHFFKHDKSAIKKSFLPRTPIQQNILISKVS